MKVPIKKGGSILLFSLVILLAGYLLATFLSAQLSMSRQNTLFMEGILVIIVGAMASMKGNNSGINMSAMGQDDNQYVQHENMEVTHTERKSTNYHENFLQHSITDFAFNTVTIIAGGVLLIIVSFI